MTPSSLIHPDVEERVERLLAQMTLAEKVGQTNQLMRLTEANKEDIRLGRKRSASLG
ncbi:MAG: hypothetical protein IH586_14830 [Anaerolineaceae bacterium]|nr:hypothetical protein [Anaerolineaceae bacterium]